jgi:hypothetical protein
MVIDKKKIISTLQSLDRLLIIARYNHIFLYDRIFWKNHMIAYRLIWNVKVMNRNSDLRMLPLFIWVKLIPVIIAFWYAIFFILLIGLNLEDTDRNMLFLINFPHTLLMFWLYHKLSNKMIRKYHEKIMWNINALKRIA